MKKGKNLRFSKKTSKNKKRILVVISVLIFFLIISFTVNDNRKLTFTEKTLKDSILFINRLILPQNNNLKDIEDNIRKEYQSEIDNLKEEINILKENLELNTILSDYEIINATTINRNLGYFYDTITLDKGSKYGIEENQAVITSGGLIGKIIKVTKYTSTVKLLTNPDSKTQVSVQIKAGDKYLYGILTSYIRDNNYYIIEGITDAEKIEIGSFVSTTGMGDVFPSGILIGEVIEIAKDNFDLEGIIKVKPSANIDNINYVKVLRRGQWL